MNQMENETLILHGEHAGIRQFSLGTGLWPKYCWGEEEEI
jgi:hypothetical protein